MSAYLTFFELQQSPFEGQSQTQVVLGTRALRDAFATISSGLEDGASRICVSGGPGLGKTSLARALPKLLGDTARVAVVRDPSAPWESLRDPIARQWGLKDGALARGRLVEAAKERRLVLVVDQAEAAGEEFLDHLDIVLSYRTEADEPVVQSILLARLTAGPGSVEEPSPLLWWLDRIQTLQLEFAPLPREGVESYIHKHLKRAGWRGDQLFTEQAALAIHEYTSGIPGEVSTLCEKLLAEAADCDQREIDEAFVRHFCEPPETAPEATDEQEAPWSFDDEIEEFEELVLNQSALDEPQAEGPPSQPEHATEPSPAEEDPSMVALEDYLSAPATAEELRVIRGSPFARQAKAIAAAAIAALLGGIAFAWLGGDDSATKAPASDHAAAKAQNGPHPTQTPAAFGTNGRPDKSGSPSTVDPAEQPPGVLARVRGPVLPDSPAASPRKEQTEGPPNGAASAAQAIAAPSTGPPVTTHPAPRARTPLEALAQSGGPLKRIADVPSLPAALAEAGGFEDEQELEDDGTDARPSSLPPAPGDGAVGEERFW
ncbi:MAG: hypothetical protein CL908_08600 [Deltaproteobacteria bacterium]|nr:hypothetical protein [Deltaproteobacteria bacterium]